MSRSLRARFAVALALVTLAVYAQVGTFEFVRYDDGLYVTDNPHVSTGLHLDGVVWAFREPGYNWYPLTWISHMLDVELFGMWAGGHHLMGLALHVANTVLLFWLLATASGAPRRSAVVAALFALHPLHVETVAWVADRKDLLSTSFGLLAGLAYLGFAERRTASRYAAVAVLFAAALMTKSMLVTLPCVFLLLDYWPLRRSDRTPWRALVVEKLPLLALSVGASLLAVATQRAAGAMEHAAAVPLDARLANAAVSYVAYLGDTLWPTQLSILRPHPSLPRTGGTPLAAWQTVGAALVLAVITLASLWSRRRYWIVGWLFYLGTLAPVIGLIQVGVAGRADRYTYLPLVGVFIAFVWGAAEIWERLRHRWGTLTPEAERRLAGVAAGALVVACAVPTFVQTRHWRSSVPLYENAVRAHPSALAHVGLGEVLASRGDLARAEASYRTALALTPDSSQVHTNLGYLLLQRGDQAGALDHFEQALRREPTNVECHVNLANALAASGRLDAAIARYHAALELDPGSAEAHYNLGNTLLAAGRPDVAVRHFRAAVHANPDFAQAHVNLGYALSSQGQLDSAIRHFERALKIEPRYEKARMALRRTLAARTAAGG